MLEGEFGHADSQSPSHQGLLQQLSHIHTFKVPLEMYTSLPASRLLVESVSLPELQPYLSFAPKQEGALLALHERPRSQSALCYVVGLVYIEKLPRVGHSSLGHPWTYVGCWGQFGMLTGSSDAMSACRRGLSGEQWVSCGGKGTPRIGTFPASQIQEQADPEGDLGTWQAHSMAEMRMRQRAGWSS